MRAGDDVHADEFAFDGLDGLGTGVSGGFDRRDIADNDRGDQGIANLSHRAGEFDVRGFEHGVGALDESNEAARFNESNSLMRHILCLVDG
jgi:hypothetical protein